MASGGKRKEERGCEKKSKIERQKRK